jgi:nicotinamidase-related amidase
MKTALLIIDVQNDYFEGGKCELIDPLPALAKVEHVLKCFREKGGTVIHVQHVNDNGGIGYFFPDTHGVKIHDKVTPADREYLVRKNDPNCFHQTKLRDILREEGITDLVVCGMMTHMCIDTSVRAARYEGLKITLLYDACATRNLTVNGEIIPAGTVHKAFMAALNGRFAEVADTPRFIMNMGNR